MIEKPISRTELFRRRLDRIRTGVRKALPFTAGILAALLAVIFYTQLFPGAHQLTPQDVSTSVAQILASATPAPAFSTRAYQLIQPSIVLVQIQAPDLSGQTENGLGSGVIIDDSGDILTSLHVVLNASNIQVTFADGTQSSAQVISTQPQNDIAVLRANQPPQQIVPAILGNPKAMRVGDQVYAVGNPFGLYSSMSAGVISAFGRSFKPNNSNISLEGLIQIDAAVNPGNSGGPLINRDGQVIGIIDGLVNPTDQNFFIGIGFAVPINIAVSGLGSPPD